MVSSLTGSSMRGIRDWAIESSQTGAMYRIDVLGSMRGIRDWAIESQSPEHEETSPRPPSHMPFLSIGLKSHLGQCMLEAKVR